MSIHWQTGEPPEGKILAEYRMRGLAKVYQDVIHNARHCEVEILRWSTLNAAPDVVGRLEKRLRENEKSWISLDMLDGHFEAVMYDNDFDERAAEATAPSLAAAIEQLCEKQ